MTQSRFTWHKNEAGLRRRLIHVTTVMFSPRVTLVIIAMSVGIVASTVLTFQAGKGIDLVVSLVANALFIPLGALLAVLYLTTGKNRIIEHQYRWLAAQDPEPLLSSATRRAFRVERPKLSRDLLVELHASPPGVLHVVTGPAGSGKTTMLQALIAELATTKFTPVVLRADHHPDFSELEQSLQASFVAAIDRVVRTAADAERAWRTIRSTDAVVVVVDGLDDWRAHNGMSPGDALTVLRYEAQNTPYRFIVAVRSEDADFAVNYPTFVLPPLELTREVLDEVLQSHPLPVNLPTRLTWESVLEATDATRFPLFMDLSLQLIGAVEALADAAQHSREEAQLALLDAWLKQRQRRFVAHYTEAADQLGNRLMLLTKIAFCMSLEGRLDVSAAEARELLERLLGEAPTKLRWRVMVGAYQVGRGLDLLQATGSREDTQQRFQFHHSIFQVYLTVIFLRSHSAQLDFATVSDGSGELLLALEYYLKQGATTKYVEHCRRQGLTRLQTSHEGTLNWLKLLARLNNSKNSDGTVLLEIFAERFPKSDDEGQLQLIELLARSGLGFGGYQLLWQWARRGNYAVGIAAARALASGGSDSLDAIGPQVHELLKRNEKKWLYNAEDWIENGGTVTTMSVVIPAWRESVRPEDRPQLESWIRILLELVTVGQLGGIESSIVEGFRGALAANRAADVWEHIRELQETVRSHDARQRIVHIIGQYWAAAPASFDPRGQLKRFTSQAEHPYVRQAAFLVEKQHDREDAEVIWRAGEHAEPKAGARLASRAHQILSDSYLLLALEDQGSGSSEAVARRQASWLSQELPWCLSRSVDRDELFTGCARECSFNLCPLDLDSLVVRRSSPISEAFLMRASHLTVTERRPWNKLFYGHQSAYFWERLRTTMELLRGNSKYDDWRNPVSTQED